MKVVILAGGLGTRISEETGTRPKPMVEIGGKPILWHIMKTYSAHGIHEFIVCCGYKGYVVKEFFANYFLHTSDVTIDLAKNAVEVHDSKSEPWKVTLVDTGENTMTGGRLKRVARYLDPSERFCMTYGDGVSDVDITGLIRFAKEQGTLATLTAVQPAGRFGKLEFNEGRITQFKEKPDGDGAWINGGFFVLHPDVLELCEGDDTIWERAPLEKLSARGQLSAYAHKGFWQPVDTLREKTLLDEMWRSGKAPWKTWG